MLIMSGKQLLAFYENGGEWEDSHHSLLGVAYVTVDRAYAILLEQVTAYVTKEKDAGNITNDPEIKWFPTDGSTDRFGWYAVYANDDSVSFTFEVTSCFEGMVPT
jgi:hypothetical protein